MFTCICCSMFSRLRWVPLSSQKLWKIKHVYITVGTFSNFKLMGQFNIRHLAFSLPKVHSIWFWLFLRNWLNTDFSSCTSFPYSFITFGNKGYAGSPSIIGGIQSFPGSIVQFVIGNLFSEKSLFIFELAYTHASCTLPGHIISTSINIPL